MQTLHYGFIGSGNMAQSIIAGMINSGINATRIWASDTNENQLNTVSQLYGIHTDSDNSKIFKQSDVLIISVKPNHVKEICLQYSQQSYNTRLIISIAAGISTTAISSWIKNNITIIRCMPNTPAMLQTGACGLYTDKDTLIADKIIAEEIFSNTGKYIWVEDEELIHAVTALSGSGPAYFFLFTELMIQAAVKQGLSQEAAEILAKQTAYGAAKMAINSEISLEQLRHNVTSPGGTTEQALNSFMNHNLAEIVETAMNAAMLKSKEIANSASKEK